MTVHRSARLAHLLRCLAILLAVTLTPKQAFADDALARQHFKKGIELYDRKRYAEALAAFQDAYREKPSAGIKQNIALCLKGLERPAEAATSFDEALEEGKGTLKPETRTAIERELSELSKTVATVNITVVAMAGGNRQPVDDFTIMIEPVGQPARTVPPGAQKRPIRLMPGIYTFLARVPNYPNPPNKKLALVSGAPVDATFVVGEGQITPGVPGQQGTLTIRASRPEAKITVDGVDVGQGSWAATVASGSHQVEVSAPGWKTSTVEVAVSAGASVEYPVKLQAEGEVPPEYFAPTTKLPPKRSMYLAVTLAIDSTSYRLGVPLGEPAPYGTRRGDFGGGTVGARFGYFLKKGFSLELLADVGSQKAKYRLRPSDSADSETTIVHWQVTPALRFASPGNIRFTAGTGFGLHGLAVDSTFPTTIGTATLNDSKSGKGVAFSWLLDSGIQLDFGPVAFEAVVFLDVHGVGTVRDDSPPEDRFLYASPAMRGGLRVGLLIFF